MELWLGYRSCSRFPPLQTLFHLSLCQHSLLLGETVHASEFWWLWGHMTLPSHQVSELCVLISTTWGNWMRIWRLGAVLLNVYRIAQHFADTDTSHVVAIIAISIEEKEKLRALSRWWFALGSVHVVTLGAGSVPGSEWFSHPTLLAPLFRGAMSFLPLAGSRAPLTRAPSNRAPESGRSGFQSYPSFSLCIAPCLVSLCFCSSERFLIPFALLSSCKDEGE